MKKLALASLLFSAVQAYAFDVSLGAKIGANFGLDAALAHNETLPAMSVVNQFDSVQSKDVNYVFGETIIYSTIGFGKYFALSPEVGFGFGHKIYGTVHNGDSTGDPETGTNVIMTWNDLSVNLLARVRADKFFAALGPGVLFTQTPTVSGNAAKDFDLKGKTDFTVVGELGGEIPLGPGSFLFSWRTSVNVTSLAQANWPAIFNNENTTAGDFGDLRNKALSIVRSGIFVGYSIKFFDTTHASEASAS